MDTPEPDEAEHHPPGAAHRWGRALFVAAGVGLVLAVTSGLLQAFEAECRELPREDLGLVELGQLRRVVDRYKARPEVPMRLTPRQASFLLREEFELPVWVNVVGGELTFESRVPRFGRCWSVSFDGDIAVRDGVATVRPRQLIIGHLSLTPLVGGWSWEVVPLHLQLPRARELLAHVASAELDGDEILLTVDDPSWLR